TACQRSRDPEKREPAAPTAPTAAPTPKEDGPTELSSAKWEPDPVRQKEAAAEFAKNREKMAAIEDEYVRKLGKLDQITALPKDDPTEILGSRAVIFAFSPSEAVVARAVKGGLDIWDIPRDKKRSFLGKYNDGENFVFSRDGKWLVQPPRSIGEE